MFDEPGRTDCARRAMTHEPDAAPPGRERASIHTIATRTAQAHRLRMVNAVALVGSLVMGLGVALQRPGLDMLAGLLLAGAMVGEWLVVRCPQCGAPLQWDRVRRDSLTGKDHRPPHSDCLRCGWRL